MKAHTLEQAVRPGDFIIWAPDERPYKLNVISIVDNGDSSR